MAKENAKLKKELRVLHKEAKNVAASIDREAPREEARVEEARDTEEPLRT